MKVAVVLLAFIAVAYCQQSCNLDADSICRNECDRDSRQCDNDNEAAVCGEVDGIQRVCCCPILGCHIGDDGAAIGLCGGACEGNTCANDGPEECVQGMECCCPLAPGQ